MPNCCVCNQPNRANAKFCAHCRAPLVLQNKYRITRLLGRGGYGAVYQAEQLHLGNALCAVKELLPDPKATPAQQQAASEQFRLEAGLLANLNHPALPKVTDFFTEGNSHFLVMEYVEGETLEDRLRRNGGPLPEAQVLAWANELCDVLTYLHTRQPSPIIHRDVKPANIKIMPDGKLKLIDFGISKVLAKGTGDAARAVSPPYSPLEQYGKGLRTDVRSDLYALGVTLYELLTNQLPPEAPDRGTEAVLPPRQFNPALSPHIEVVILKAIAEKADERYQSAAEMKQALTLLSVPPFVFRGGGQAHDVAELVRLCDARPEDALWHLLNGHFEPWLTALGRVDLARAAAFARQSTAGGRGLEQFLDATGLPHTYTYKPPSPPPPPPPPPQPQRGWVWLAVAAIVLCALGATIFGFQQIQQQQIAQATAMAHARATTTARAQATATAQVQATITEQALATIRAEVYATATARTRLQTTEAVRVQPTPTLIFVLPTPLYAIITATPPRTSTVLPSATKPLLAPGVYVTNIRLEPPNPKNVEDIRFFVHFQNTAGPLKFQWCVYIFPAGQRSPIGQTSCSQWVHFPLGSYEYATLNTWRFGPGTPCTDFLAQVQATETDGKRLIFKTPEGKENGIYFRVCP